MEPCTAVATVTRATSHELAPAPSVPLDQHPAAIYVGSLATGSRRTMRDALEVVARILTSDRLGWLELPWHELRPQHTSLVRSVLAERYAPATGNKILAAVRGCLREAWRLRLIGAEDYHRCIDWRPIRGVRLPHGRMLALAEITALFTVCRSDRSPSGIRDAALLAILFAGGLRRQEVADLQLEHLDIQAATLRVLGKGNKERKVPLGSSAMVVLRAWLERRGGDPGPLLFAVAHGRIVTGHAIGTQSLYEILIRRASQAGVRRFSPHDTRRTYASSLLGAGADLNVVSALMGHASVTTTSRYDLRSESERRKAAELVFLPAWAA